MTARAALREPTWLSIRWLCVLAASQIVFAVQAYLLFADQGRFPAPIFFGPFDTLMDFYHTTYWAFNSERYELWRAIYPIFSFLVAHWIGNADCATVGPFEMRECEPYAAWPLLLAYLIGAYFTTRILLSRVSPSRIPRWCVALLLYGVILLCLPGLFALERGNYILITFGCVAAATYWKSDWRGAVLLAVAINLKQYLLLLWLVALIKRRFGWLAISVCAALALNFLGLLLIPESHYSMLLNNMVGFSTGESTSYFEKLWYSTSFSSWIRTLDYSPQIGGRLWGYQFDIAYAVISFMRWGSLACATACCVAAASRYRVVSEEYISFCFLLALLIATESAGGYAIMLLLPLFGGVLDRNQLKWAPWMMLLLMTPLDLALAPSLKLNGPNYFTGLVVATQPALTLGTYARPCVLAALSIYLLADLLRSPLIQPGFTGPALRRNPRWQIFGHPLFE